MKRALEMKRAVALKAKLEAVTGNEKLLNPEQLGSYRAWKSRRSAARMADMTDDQLAALYEASLQPNFIDPDPMRPDIEAILYPISGRILESDTVEQSAEKYYQSIQSN